MAEQKSVGILLKDKPALQASDDKDNRIPWECKVHKGDIVEEIPPKDRVHNPDHPSHNYRLYSEPDVTLNVAPTDISVLHGNEADYLLAVQPPSARVTEYFKQDKMKEKMEIKMGDLVIFRYSIKKDAPGGSFVHGKVQYIGFVRESDGIYFGIEILDDKYRGKGNTNGRPHFTCGANNGVFVSIDKILQKSVKDEQHFPNNKGKQNSSNERQPSPVVQQPTRDSPHGAGPRDNSPHNNGPAANTRSQKDKESSSYFQRARGVVSNITNKFAGNDPPMAKGESLPNVQYQYKPGDRVVLHSVHYVPIEGTVRWTGHVTVNKIPIPTVGVETVRRIDVDRDLPDTHLKVTDGHGHELFKVTLDHSRVFVPEQLVVPIHEYTEQKKKDDESQNEQKVAKSLGISVEEYRAQKELLDQANKERDDKNDQRFNQPFIPPDPPIEEEGTAGAGPGGVEDSVALVTSGQPVSDERMEEERKALERFNSQVDNQPPHPHQPPHPLYHEYEEIPGLIQQRVIEGTGYVDIQYNTDQFKGPAGNGASAGSSHGNPPPVYQNVPVNDIQAIKHGHSPNMSNRENYSSLPSILNDRQPSVPVSSSPLNIEDQFAIGSMVVIPTQGGNPLKGVVKWIGTLPEVPGLIAGVELDTEYPNCTDGTWKGRRFFKCPNGRGYFCPLRSLQQDVTFIDKGQVAGPVRQSIENPLKNKSVLIDEKDGLIKTDQFSKYIGFEHGIQGHYNSCYLDSTVFGLFALSEIFDEMFLQEPNDEAGRKIRDILWKGIINPLRNHGLALHESVMRLRDSLEELGQMKGANRDEKDPEEFLNLLFKEILHVEPFLSIKRPFGVEKEFFIQLFLQVDPNDPHIPETEKLLHQFFHENNISFTKPPSKLLLQMPRFGKDFKMCDKIIPSLQLNVRPLVDRENRSNMDYDDSAVYTMNLLSVICIETSHYVCFTRDKNNKWLFHDSMADRVYDMYNIPRVDDVTDCLNEWVYSPENHERLMKTPSKSIPEYVRRFTQDIYMCVYVNEYLAMHGTDDPESTLSPSTTTVTQQPALYDYGPNVQSPTLCCICLNEPASKQCSTCPKDLFNNDNFNNDNQYVLYCARCNEIVHQHRQLHRVVDYN